MISSETVLFHAGWCTASMHVSWERWLTGPYDSNAQRRCSAGDPVQARTAFGEAATIIGGQAEDIKDETLRARFLAGPPIQQVVQQAHQTPPTPTSRIPFLIVEPK